MIHWICSFFVDWHNMFYLQVAIIFGIIIAYFVIRIIFDIDFNMFGKLIICFSIILLIKFFGFLYDQTDNNEALLNESAIQTTDTITYDVNYCEADRLFYDINGQEDFLGYSMLTFFEEKQSEHYGPVGVFGEQDESKLHNFILIVNDENAGDMKITSTKTRIKREGMINVLWFHIYYSDNLLDNELEKNEMHVSPSFYENIKEYKNISYLPGE